MNSIAIIGASSQIAKDLVVSFAKAGRRKLMLYVRSFKATQAWVKEQGLDHICSIHSYETYGDLPHDVIINFVGVGDPRRAVGMGSSIFEVTSRFDNMIMDELKSHPDRRYIFLSSGAVFGDVYAEPVTEESQAKVSINTIRPQDYYTLAKLHAEVSHRARPDLHIIDLRVFNMISRTQDINTRFFISDIIRAIRDNETLQISGDYIVRDFMHPDDFHQLVECLLSAPPINCAVDCYSREPIDKPTLLSEMANRFGLRYKIISDLDALVNATGAKSRYYSLSRKAAAFGYKPCWSSLDAVILETEAILSNYASTN